MCRKFDSSLVHQGKSHFLVNIEDIFRRMREASKTLKFAGINVIREKIELILYDTKDIKK